MKKDSDPLANHSCACAGGRRDFLRQAGALLAGLAAGGAGLAAAGLPVRFGEAGSKAGDELTFPNPSQPETMTHAYAGPAYLLCLYNVGNVIGLA